MKQFLASLVRAFSPVLVAAMLLVPAVALAQGPPAGTTVPGASNVGTSDLKNISAITGTIFNTITTVAVIIFVILLLVGGIQYLASFGNEEATTKAKKLIVDAVVGLFIVLAAAGIANFVFQQLGVSGVDTFFSGSPIGR